MSKIVLAPVPIANECLETTQGGCVFLALETQVPFALCQNRVSKVQRETVP